MEPTIQIANINAMLQVSHDELGELPPPNATVWNAQSACAKKLRRSLVIITADGEVISLNKCWAS